MHAVIEKDRINRKTRDIMICLTVKLRFGDHEIARHGSRNMRYLGYS